MAGLAELQGRLRLLLTDPRGPGAASPDDPPRARLAVYADAYFLRLLEALGGVYPAVRRTVGGPGFRRLAADYLAENPPHAPVIELAGSGLPGFLAGHRLGRRLPFLPELARLEWELLECLYTDRLPPLGPRTLPAAAADWSAARVTFDPTARLFESEWPVDLVRDRSEARPPRRRRRLLLYRDDVWVRTQVLGLEGARVFRELRSGSSLGAVCARLARRRGARAAETARGLLAAWRERGVIKGVTL